MHAINASQSTPTLAHIQCTLSIYPKVAEDLNYVVLLRKKFAYLESIPGVLLPHPSSSGVPMSSVPPLDPWPTPPYPAPPPLAPPQQMEFYDQFLNQQSSMRITPSMSSLEALLSKLPSVGPSANGYCEMTMPVLAVNQRPAKEEMEEEEYGSSSSMSYYVNHVGKAEHHRQQEF